MFSQRKVYFKIRTLKGKKRVVSGGVMGFDLPGMKKIELAMYDLEVWSSATQEILSHGSGSNGH